MGTIHSGFMSFDFIFVNELSKPSKNEKKHLVFMLVALCVCMYVCVNSQNVSSFFLPSLAYTTYTKTN